MGTQIENKSDRQFRISLEVLICCLAFFLVTLDATIVNAALFRIQSAWRIPLSQIQWIVDTYTISLAALMLSTGVIADRIGAHHLLRVGFLIFLLASLGCACAPGISLLIAMRIVQGLGAALMLPASLAFMSKSVQSDVEKVRTTSLWAAAGGVAVVLGPVLGGILTSVAGWQSVFGINIPICALCLIYLFRHPHKEITIKRSFDMIGQILGAGFLLCITAGIVEFHHGTGKALILLLLGIIIGVVFLIFETQTPHPAFPLSLWKNTIFDSCALTGFTLNFSYFGAIFVLGLLFQASYKFSPAISGLMFIPLTIFIMVSNLISGKISAKYDAFYPLLWGQLIEGGGFFLVAYAVFTHAILVMSVAMPLIGIGAGLASPPMMSTLLSSVSTDNAGLAAGVLNCLRQFGTVLGVAVFGLLIAGNMDNGTALCLIISGLMLIISASGTFLLIPRKARNKAQK